MKDRRHYNKNCSRAFWNSLVATFLACTVAFTPTAIRTLKNLNDRLSIGRENYTFEHNPYFGEYEKSNWDLIRQNADGSFILVGEVRNGEYQRRMRKLERNVLDSDENIFPVKRAGKIKNRLGEDLSEMIDDHDGKILDNEEKKILDDDERAILGEVKYFLRPTKYAGQIQDGRNVNVIERNEEAIRKVTAKATYYSSKSASKKTATGVPLRDDRKTAAINERLGWELPCRVRVTNLKNGKSTEVSAIDHGPYAFDTRGNPKYNIIKKYNRKLKIYEDVKVYIPNEDGRFIDLSVKAAEELNMLKDGVVPVEIEYLGRLVK